MFFTLDRIEENTIAVLIDDDGKKYEIPVSMLAESCETGNVYTYVDGNYIYNEKETKNRRNSNSEKLKKLFNKAINR